jgi:hypothetical protein
MQKGLWMVYQALVGIPGLFGAQNPPVQEQVLISY